MKNAETESTKSIPEPDPPRKYQYIARYFTYNGTKYRVRGKTLEEALEKKYALIERLKHEEIKANNMTVRQWTEKALETFKPNVSPDYLYQMTGRIEKHILSQIGSLRLQDVTKLDCQEVLNLQAGASQSQLIKLRQELKFIFETAKEQRLITYNPAARLTLPAGTKGRRRSITPVERFHFLKVSEGRPEYMIFRLMLFCGLRSSEAINLQYSDILTMQGVSFFHVRGTKTAAADRLIPIPPEIQKDLKKRGTGNIARNISGEPITKNSYRRLSDHLRRDLNISMGCTVFRNQLIPPLPLAPDFVPYFFRHTFCTDLKKKGVDLRLAKSLMGHSDIKMTADIYDHADDESALLAASQMGIITK